LLYFHQFPAYFIPANLVAIPLSFLAIYAGVAVLATSFIPVISNFLGLLTNYLLFALNYSVGFIEKLPYSVLKITSVTQKEMILLYLILISILLIFFYKRIALLFATLALLLVLSLSFTLNETLRQRQQKIIFYSLNKQSAIGFINGKEQILIADSVLLNDKAAIKFQLDGTRTLWGLTSTKNIALDTIVHSNQNLHENLKALRSQGNNFLFRNKRIVIIDSIPTIRGSCIKLKVDYLVLKNNPKFKIKNLLQLYQPGCVIVDGSNSFYRTEKWLAEFKKAGVKAYSVKNSGAYVVEL